MALACRAPGGVLAYRAAGMVLACRMAGMVLACRMAGMVLACRAAAGMVLACRAAGMVLACRMAGMVLACRAAAGMVLAWVLAVGCGDGGAMLGSPDARAAVGADAGEPGAVVADFRLIDQNPTSPRADAAVSPRDYLMRVSGWYFTHAG